MGRLIDISLIRTRDTVSLAPMLLGKNLVVRTEGRRHAHRITEVEAYDGSEDKGCHASRGRTRRTEVMFARGGVWYVYLIYGMHEMLNLVTGPRDYPAAVLIRGIAGHKGPGRLTRALGIDRRFNGKAANRATGLWIEDDGFSPSPDRIQATPRIGIDYAGPKWASKPWRFVLKT